MINFIKSLLHKNYYIRIVYYFLLRKKVVKNELQFEVHLAEHCNLNCKGCDNFSPLAKEEYTDIRTYEKDIIRLAELFEGNARRIFLLGGEPLLNEKIIEFCEITRKFFKTCEIVIVTNGIKLNLMDNEFWTACKRNNIGISITKYPIKTSYKAIIKKGQNENVKVGFFDMCEDDKKMKKMPIDLAGNQNSILNFYSCHRANQCIFLKEGNLYSCSMIPNIVHFNKYYKKDLKVLTEDRIDIYTAEAKQILKFLSKPIPFCRYCNMKKMKYDIEWEVSKKDINEWI